jgi:hypothetical protein
VAFSWLTMAIRLPRTAMPATQKSRREKQREQRVLARYMCHISRRYEHECCYMCMYVPSACALMCSRYHIVPYIVHAICLRHMCHNISLLVAKQHVSHLSSQ